LACDAVTKAVNQRIDDVRIIDAAVVRAVDRPQFRTTVALSEQGSDVFDTAGEAQIVVKPDLNSKWEAYFSN